MDKSICPCDTVTYDLSDDLRWAELYPRLHAIARHLVYKYRIPCWYGQEEELAEDVTQETARRLIERLQKAARGEAAPIDSPEQMMVTIAHNYLIDLIRHEHRVTHLLIEELTLALGRDGTNCVQMEEVATKNIYNEWLFLQLAHEIAHFPCKQRQALLIDLANRMDFGEQPTALQAAFLAVSIDLRAYQQSLPDDPAERAQRASSLYWAYQRIMRFAGWQDDETAA